MEADESEQSEEAEQGATACFTSIFNIPCSIFNIRLRIFMGLRLGEKQKRGWEILTDPGKTRILFDGGSRSGKTSLIMEYIVMRALRYPGSRQLMARKHRAHAKQSLWSDTLKRYLSAHIPPDIRALSESELSVTFKNGSTIITGGLDDSDRMEKILGNEYITIFLNEATQLSWGAVQMSMTRLAQSVRDPESGSLAAPKLIMDCNPRGPRHWLHTAGVKGLDPETGAPHHDAENWARLHWSAYDNAQNLPDAYIKTLEALSPVMRARMLNGEWRAGEGLVYDEFSEDIHTVEPFEIPPSWTRIRAVDFGFTNPFVCLWGALDQDGRLYIYRELYRAGVRTAVHAAKITELSAGEIISRTVTDHDAGERAELEAAGIRSENALKNVRDGIQAVKSRLAKAGDGKPRLFLLSSLRSALSEICEYSWDSKSASGAAKEEPLKENDHAMDALRYMVMAVDRRKTGPFQAVSAPVAPRGSICV
jgi:phage terminase large subunit